MNLRSLEIPFSIAEQIKHPPSYIKSTQGGTKHRRIFNKATDCDEEEKKLIGDIKTLLEQNQTLIPPIFSKNIDAKILRFLYANKLDTTKTYQRILDHFAWISNDENFKLSEESFSFLEKGIIYLANCDIKLRPMIIVNTMKIDFSKLDINQLFKACFALLNLIKEVIFVPGFIENWIVLIDLDGFVDKKEEIQQLYQQNIEKLIEVFQLNYPIYLEKLYLVNFPHIYLDFLQKFREKLTLTYEGLMEKITILSKDELEKLQENIDKSQIEKKYGGDFRNLQVFWPPKNILNPKFLRVILPKKELYNNSEFFLLHESEEEVPKKRKVPKFKDLSYSPLKIEKENKINRQYLVKNCKRPPKFREHSLFEKTLPKQFLLEDWESVASSSSVYSQPRNPLITRQNKFIEDYDQHVCITENPEIFRGSFKRESTRQLYEAYFNKKYKGKLSSDANLDANKKKNQDCICGIFSIAREEKKEEEKNRSSCILI